MRASLDVLAHPVLDAVPVACTGRHGKVSIVTMVRTVPVACIGDVGVLPALEPVVAPVVAIFHALSRMALTKYPIRTL